MLQSSVPNSAKPDQLWYTEEIGELWYNMETDVKTEKNGVLRNTVEIGELWYKESMGDMWYTRDIGELW